MCAGLPQRVERERERGGLFPILTPTAEHLVKLPQHCEPIPPIQLSPFTYDLIKRKGQRHRECIGMMMMMMGDTIIRHRRAHTHGRYGHSLVIESQRD